MLVDYKKIKEILDDPKSPKVVIIKNNEPKNVKQLLVTNLVKEIKKEKTK